MVYFSLFFTTLPQRNDRVVSQRSRRVASCHFSITLFGNNLEYDSPFLKKLRVPSCRFGYISYDYLLLSRIIFVFVYSLSGDSGQAVRAMETSIQQKKKRYGIPLCWCCLHTGLDQNAFPLGAENSPSRKIKSVWRSRERVVIY